MSESEASRPDRPLWAFGWFVLAWASFAIFLGANVTTTESGDASPDWPASWAGEYLPPHRWFEIFSLRNELSHRYVVSALVALMVVLAFWVQRKRREKTLRVLAWTSVGILLLQALLGGIRVLRWIPIRVSAVAHAILAEVFFCLLIGPSRSRPC